MSSIHATTVSPHFLTPSSSFSPFFFNHPTPSSSCRLDEGGGGLLNSALSSKNFNDVFDHLLASTDVICQQQQHHQQQQQRYERSPLLDMAHLFSPTNDLLNGLDFSSFMSSSDSSPSLSTKRVSPTLTLQVPDLSNVRPKAKKVVPAATEEPKKKRNTSSKRKKEEEESICDEEEDDNCSDNSLSQTDRTWQVVQISEKFKNNLSVTITSKTRCEEPSEFVPSKLYSSLKYEIRQQAKLNTHIEDLPFLLGRISMVDSQTFEEIQQDNKSNPVLKGVTESALTKKPESKSSKKNAVPSSTSAEEFNGVLKVQSSTVSYHHKKINFCWQINYFTPSDLENPIMTVRSAAFKVYARKPSQNKKKKRTNTQETTTTTTQVTTTTTEQIIMPSCFDEFANCVDELVEFSKKLKEGEKKRSIELLSSKLLQLDPTFFQECLESFRK